MVAGYWVPAPNCVGNTSFKSLHFDGYNNTRQLRFSFLSYPALDDETGLYKAIYMKTKVINQ